MSNTRCAACGKPITWMKTKAGKSMPCDSQLVQYWEDENGQDKVITHAGEIVRCSLQGPGDERTGLGRVPHWGSCTNPNRFRKRGKIA